VANYHYFAKKKKIEKKKNIGKMKNFSVNIYIFFIKETANFEKLKV
jgi:hypothetical protein